MFSRLRAEALKGESDDVLYVEFSAPANADPDDPKAVAEANPSYPKRTKPKAIRRLRKLLSVEDYMREVLGIWDDDVQVGNGLTCWRGVGWLTAGLSRMLVRCWCWMCHLIGGLRRLAWRRMLVTVARW